MGLLTKLAGFLVSGFYVKLLPSFAFMYNCSMLLYKYIEIMTFVQPVKYLRNYLVEA